MLIVLEGIDGSGTTTQCQLLTRALEAQGHATLQTFEPSAGPVGVVLRQALRRRLVQGSGEALAAETLALLFAADRIDHLREEIEPALAAGQIVICDRYVHSSIAYQGSDLPVEWVAAINGRARAADLVIYLEVPVRTCLERLGKRSTREIFEEEAILDRVAQGYEAALASRNDPVFRVDGSLPLDEVAAQILAEVQRRMGA